MCTRQHRIIWTNVIPKPLIHWIAAFHTKASIKRYSLSFYRFCSLPSSAAPTRWHSVIRLSDRCTFRPERPVPPNEFLAGENSTDRGYRALPDRVRYAGISARNGEHRHIRLVALNKLRKRIRAAYLMAAKALTDELRICVKRTQQFKAAGRKLKLLSSARPRLPALSRIAVRSSADP